MRDSAIDSSNIGFQLLKKHGWKEGTGLGVSEHGRLEPIEAPLKNNKRGLGADNGSKSKKKILKHVDSPASVSAPPSDSSGKDKQEFSSSKTKRSKKLRKMQELEKRLQEKEFERAFFPCKYLRRRCPSDCIFSPYFPSNNPQRFASVHRIYGASNVAKMLQQLPVHLRAEAANSLYYEAQCRIQDPVYGCVGILSWLQQQLHDIESQLAKTKAEIVVLKSLGQGPAPITENGAETNLNNFYNSPAGQFSGGNYVSSNFM